MKISVAEDRTILLQEIFCNTVLETAEGNRLAICMRDDTIEMNVVGHHPCWYRVNMQTGKISPLRESAKTDTQHANTAIALDSVRDVLEEYIEPDTCPNIDYLMDQMEITAQQR